MTFSYNYLATVILCSVLSKKKPCRDRHSRVTTKIAAITVVINILKYVTVPTQGDIKPKCLWFPALCN